MKKIKEYEESSLEAFRKEVNKYEVLGEEEQKKLLDEYKKTKDIRILDKIVKHNLRLSIAVANRYRHNRKSMEIIDLIQECNISLILAIESYENNHNTKFSTYAVAIMENNIKSTIYKNDDIIRKPMYLESINIRKKKFIEKFYKEKERYPTDKEIIESLQISKVTYDILKKMATYEIKSLNEIKDEDEDELQSFIKIEETNYEKIQNTIDDLIIMKAVRNLLTEQEYYVIYYRKLSSEELTLEKISQDLSITSERVRQIEQKALGKLKMQIKEEQKRILKKYDIKQLEQEDFQPISLKKKCLFLYFKETMTEEDYYYLYTRNILNYDIFDYKKELVDFSQKEVEELIEIYDEIYKQKINSDFVEENYNRYKKLYTVYKLFKMSIDPNDSKETQKNSEGMKLLWKKKQLN